MNIVSTMVGMSIMAGAAAPMMQMSIAPFEAQKRATNLGGAESTAVTYAAAHEGARPRSLGRRCEQSRARMQGHG